MSVIRKSKIHDYCIRAKKLTYKNQLIGQTNKPRALLYQALLCSWTDYCSFNVFLYFGTINDWIELNWKSNQDGYKKRVDIFENGHICFVFNHFKEFWKYENTF